VGRADRSPRLGYDPSTWLSQPDPALTPQSGSDEGVRRTDDDYTASFSALRGRIFTTLRAAFAL